VAFEQGALLVYIRKRGDFDIYLQLPMPLTRRFGLEVNPSLAVRQRTLGGMGVSHHSVS
jgi:hypothetical protein